MADQTQQGGCQLCWSGSPGWSAVVVAAPCTAQPGCQKGRRRVAQTRPAGERLAWQCYISGDSKPLAERAKKTDLAVST